MLRCNIGSGDLLVEKKYSAVNGLQAAEGGVEPFISFAEFAAQMCGIGSAEFCAVFDLFASFNTGAGTEQFVQSHIRQESRKQIGEPFGAHISSLNKAKTLLSDTVSVTWGGPKSVEFLDGSGNRLHHIASRTSTETVSIPQLNQFLNLEKVTFDIGDTHRGPNAADNIKQLKALIWIFCTNRPDGAKPAEITLRASRCFLPEGDRFGLNHLVDYIKDRSDHGHAGSEDFMPGIGSIKLEVMQS
ncbi:MAG: hypothetical protein LBB38_02145 [Puniceicoccales bacterium]|jgi:hypothetical protein|nr:hypothetical protein [Puniceicoccales bacterium]